MQNTMQPRTLYDKLWQSHLVDINEDGEALLYVDRHLLYEVTSPQAFEGLRLAGRTPWRKETVLATVDHNVPTTRAERNGIDNITDQFSRQQLRQLGKNVREFGITAFELGDIRQGIIHVVGPEQGATLPGMTVVAGDSHTSTHGAFAAMAFGVGTSEVEHVLATQCLAMRPMQTMLVRVDGAMRKGVSAKDLILAIIGRIGMAGGTGFAIEFGGSTIKALSMEGRMTLCNMAIEAGARVGLIGVDETTIEYLRDRPYSPRDTHWDQAVMYWRTLVSDPGAPFDCVIDIDAGAVRPMISWGTSPDMVVTADARIPYPTEELDPVKRAGIERALDYMGLEAGTAVRDIRIDKVFIGSCTNSRIEDLRAAAAVVAGKRVADSVRLAFVVPGSGLVKAQAEAEGLDRIFLDAGFEWREPGCSMCLAMNDDRLGADERCASTSNRNFEGRQGAGGRTHLVSPAMAAAAAVAGHFVDISGGNLMEPFTSLEAVVAPLDRRDIDTDAIIPKQYMKSISKTGFGDNLFDEWRYLDQGVLGQDAAKRVKNPDFVLNQAAYANARILLARENFGCGSSREHAPWALRDFGIRALIAPSFADIFYANCFKNGILPIALPPDDVDELFALVWRHPGTTFHIDLQTQIIHTRQRALTFDIPAGRKSRLLHGLDDITLTLERREKIRAYERSRGATEPWLFT